MRYTKKVLIAAATVLLVAVLIIFFNIDPEVYPFFPKCPFLVITGLECPGCGSQRAFHKLLHFNIVSAFHQNPLVVLFTPYIIFGLYLEYLGGKYKFSRIRKIIFGKNAAIILLIVIIAYWVLRNIY